MSSRSPRWQEKPCARPMCGEKVRIFGRPHRFKTTRYHSHRCAVLAYADTARAGRENASIERSVQAIQRACGVSGSPSPELVRIVRRLRRKYYAQGWQVAARKVRRAIARGDLVPAKAALKVVRPRTEACA